MMNTVLSQKRQVITPDMRQGIARAFQNGKSFDEIKVMFSVSGTSIRRILDENKIPYTKKRRFWTEDEKKKIERYVNLGWDIPTIAKQLGRQEGSVGAYIKKYINLDVSTGKVRKIHKWRTSEAIKCQELYEQGKTPMEIAEVLGRTEGSVSGWISDNLRNTVHFRTKRHRLDGTPMPENKKEETPVKPSLAEQIENAKTKMADESGLKIVENHTRVIKGKGGTYTINMVDETINCDFEELGCFIDKEHFGMFVDELAKVYALM